MKMNMKEWASGIINQPERVAIPIMTHPGIELIGKSVKDVVTDGKVHFEAIQALDKKYPSAACTVIMDLTVESEAFGATINLPDNEVPTVTGILTPDYEAVQALQVPDITAARVPQYLLANQLAVENITSKPIFGGCIGPFSLAGRLFGMTEIMLGIYTEPETVTLLLEKCTEFLLKYAKAIKEKGVNGIVIAEPAAGLISNDDCSAYSSQYVKKIVDELQDDSFMVILHNCGNTGHCTTAMLETTANGLHFGNKIDMGLALEQCPENVLVLGNIDPVADMKMSTPEELKQKTTDLLKKTASHKNYVLSTGCDVPPHVSHANIEAFYQALTEFNAN